MEKRVRGAAQVGLSVALAASLCAAGDIWDYEAVNADGTGSHPLVDAAPAEENRVTVVGIALNTTGELLDPSQMYSIFIQDETDWGGMQVWAGSWWYDPWPHPNYIPVEAGDRVQVRGLLGNHNGKVFINDRHSSSPMTVFEVAILEQGVGMPGPDVIPSVASCNYFDQSRAGGAEYYQTHWCRLNDLEVVSGDWASGQQLVVTDGTGDVGLLLAGPGDFAGPAPTSPFDAIGIFDQEDEELPWHDSYRLWVKRDEHIAVQTDSPAGWLREGWNMMSVPNAAWDSGVSAVLSDLAAAGNVLQSSLFRFAADAGYEMYPADFTQVDCGLGYWLRLTTAADASMKGIRAAGEVTIDLAEGWSLIGHPHMDAVALAACEVSDGATTQSFADAVAAGWLQGTLYAYEASGYVEVTGGGAEDTLRPWYGYWILAYRPGLALVIPTPR